MLRIPIDLVPGGKVLNMREIGSINIWNVKPNCKYADYEILCCRENMMDILVKVKHFNREQPNGALKLLQRAVYQILKEVEKYGGKIDWVNCGLCVDERGVNNAVEGTRRGGPPDLHMFVEISDNTLVIATK